mgnify:CR=1 FL=1
MKHCSECGHKLYPDDKYCMNCGFNIHQKEPHYDKAKNWKKWCTKAFIVLLLLNLAFIVYLTISYETIDPISIVLVIITAIAYSSLPIAIIYIIFYYIKKGLFLGKVIIILIILANMIYAINIVLYPEDLYGNPQICPENLIDFNGKCSPKGTTEVIDGKCAGCFDPELPIAIGDICCPMGSISIDEERQCCINNYGECLG